MCVIAHALVIDVFMLAGLVPLDEGPSLPAYAMLGMPMTAQPAAWCCTHMVQHVGGVVGVGKTAVASGMLLRARLGQPSACIMQ